MEVTTLVLAEVSPRIVGNPTILGDLPNELFPVIVDGDIKVHRGLALACKRFFSVLTPISYSMRIDYEIHAGHTVNLSKDFIKWYIKGKLHRDGDRPAIEWTNGTKMWWVYGTRHRVDGPAVEYANRKEWWFNGKRHRGGDRPAVEWVNGKKEWWVNGKRHRGDGSAIEYADGMKEWRVNGKHHDG